MTGITTHVLDTARGRPAVGVPTILSIRTPGGEWKELARRETDDDGRVGDLWTEGNRLEAGTYRLRFATEGYFQSQGVEGFYPYADVVFLVGDAGQHYHVPLLLSPWGYSTYRGS